MATYPFPDVYRQEIFPVEPPRFLTGVPVFLGYAQDGPLNEPVLFHSLPRFTATFTAATTGYFEFKLLALFARIQM